MEIWTLYYYVLREPRCKLLSRSVNRINIDCVWALNVPRGMNMSSSKVIGTPASAVKKRLT